MLILRYEFQISLVEISEERSWEGVNQGKLCVQNCLHSSTQTLKLALYNLFLAAWQEQQLW